MRAVVIVCMVRLILSATRDAALSWATETPQPPFACAADAEPSAGRQRRFTMCCRVVFIRAPAVPSASSWLDLLISRSIVVLTDSMEPTDAKLAHLAHSKKSLRIFGLFAPHF
jgi:hypothetical protein